MRLVWTRPALADVLHIRDHIAADSPRYARVVAERIVASVDRLTAFPLSGRVVPELADPMLREVIDAPYRIVSRTRRCARDPHRRAFSATVPRRVPSCPAVEDASLRLLPNVRCCRQGGY